MNVHTFQVPDPLAVATGEADRFACNECGEVEDHRNHHVPDPSLSIMASGNAFMVWYDGESNTTFYWDGDVGHDIEFGPEYGEPIIGTVPLTVHLRHPMTRLNIVRDFEHRCRQALADGELWYFDLNDPCTLRHNHD